MINPGTVLQERYLIEKQIGEGGMGAVYLAVDQRFDNYVAIKVTFYKDNEFGEAFEREAKILNGLMHPVLPHVSDYFTEGDEHFLVMQYVEGEDASDLLKRDGAFPVKDVLRWTENLLDALDYLHSQEPPIIHRDLKPSNLKITARGDIFLLDFGLAKLKKENTLTERSVFGYSRKYSPLEQIQGTGTDARSDLFALAATVYHLFTGQAPVDAIARASSIVAGKPDPILPASEINGEIPDAVASVLNSALALNAENRFASATAMHQALKHAVQGSPWDNIEALPAVPVITSETEAKLIDSTENENFPALEAFAAGNIDAPAATIENNRIAAPEIPPTDVQDVSASSAKADRYESDADLYKTSTVEPSPAAAVPVIEAPTAAPQSADVPTVVAPRRNRRRLPVAALVALFALVATVAAFFIFKNRDSADSNAAPEITAETSTDLNNSQAVSENVEKSSVPDLLETGAGDLVKTKAVAAKKTSEKTAAEEEPVIEEESRESAPTKSAKPETKRPVQKSRATNGEQRERIVRSNEVPDIESIFTGRPGWERDERQRRRAERRQMRDEMTEEEFREYRRQRRRERRQQAYPFPF